MKIMWFQKMSKLLFSKGYDFQNYRSSNWQMFFKTGILENFAVFTGVFLWILRIFWERVFYRTPLLATSGVCAIVMPRNSTKLFKEKTKCNKAPKLLQRFYKLVSNITNVLGQQIFWMQIRKLQNANLNTYTDYYKIVYIIFFLGKRTTKECEHLLS